MDFFPCGAENPHRSKFGISAVMRRSMSTVFAIPSFQKLGPSHAEIFPVQLEMAVKGDAGIFPGIIHLVLAPNQRSLNFLPHVPGSSEVPAIT